MESIRNKKYLVTGANSGIGLQTCKRLLALGARVFMVDKNSNNMEALKAENAEFCDFMVFDLSKPGEVPTLFDEAKSKGLVFDGMVYCAGISPLMSLKDFDLGLSMTTYNINLISFIATLHYFTDETFTNNGASVVGISSNSAVIGGNRQYIYSSTKSAMNMVAKSVTKELAARKTRINTVMPSTTNTEMVAQLRKQSEAIDINIKYKQPLGIIEPSQIVDAVVFLLSDNSSAVSGVTMPVNNGEVY